MNSKGFLVLTLVLVLLMSGCGRQKDDLEATTEGTTEGFAATTVQTIPGLEDSEFDDETEPTETETQTEPTENTESTESVVPTESVEPTESVAPEETSPTTEPTQPPATQQMGYEEFQNMSAADQQAFMASFENLDLFFAWYNQAKAEYEAAHPPIDVGDGSVDIGDLMD